MQKLKKLFPLVGALLALALVSCGSDSDDGSETAAQQKTAGSISYATTSVSKTTDDTAFTNELTKTGDGAVTYASSKTDVATVNETTGEVTIAGAGETTITATVADSDTYSYATKTASYALTVTAADTAQQKSAGSISYATTSVSKTTAEAAFTNTLTKTGNGTVSYTSDNTAVATVNEDGEVTIKGAGTATITATVADSDTYTYATKTASYTLTVTTAIPEGFVKVAGTTIAGTETWTPTSNVLVSGRSLTIPDLYVCDHEVTQAEYEAYCKYGSDSPSDTYGKGDSYPAYFVSWCDAIVYCNLRSMAENLTPVYAIGEERDPSKWTDIVSETTDGVTKYCGPNSTNATWDGMTFDSTANGYRLPTEAEWEYIAREAGASDTTYSGSNTIGDVAWYGSNSDSKTHEVKGKNANSLGIYDMSGNVWEWCWDWYSSSILISTDAAGAASGSGRVTRGGSRLNFADYCTVSIRACDTPNNRGNFLLGFRVVRSSSN